MAKKLKVGIVGVGSIYRSHVPGWQGSPDAELVALADINPVQLNKVGDELGVKLRYEKAEDLYANKDIDIVDICTASQYHAPLAIAALEAGKHVLCEKPLAPKPSDIKKMIAARDKSKVLLMAAQHMRFQAASQALKEEVVAGRLGDVYHARGWMLRRASAPARPSYVSKQHAGGGACLDIGVHILDLTLWLMGNPRPVAVTGIAQDKLAKMPGTFLGKGNPIPESWDVEEFAAGFVRMDNGATLILEVSWLLHHPTDSNECRIWLYGTKAGGTWPELRLTTTNAAAKRHEDHTLKVSEGMEAHAAECVAFADAVAHGKPAPVPPEQSLDVGLILDGLYQSSVSGREVAIER